MTEQERDAQRLGEQLEKETDKLEHRSQELGGEIEDARTDWESKRSDPGVPGAVPPADEEQTDSDDESDEREDRAQGNDGS